MTVKKMVIPVAAVACIAAVVCMICALTLHKPASNDFTPPAFDSAAQNGTPTVPDDLGYSSLDAKAFQVSVCGKLIANDDKADMYLTNHDGNAVWLKVRLLDENDAVLGETGLIKPGQYIKSVTLDTVPTKTCSVKIKIMAYEPETYYSAGAVSLNTTLSIG